MLKQNPTATAAKLALQFKCGDCLHFEKVPKFEKPCSKLGVTKHGSAPTCFTPNVFQLQRHVPDVLNQLGFLLKDLTGPEHRILMGLLRSRTAFDSYKLKFGQPVYVCLGQDYLSNYVLGYVVGVGSYGSHVVYVTSDLNKAQVSKPAILSLMPDSVYSATAFKKKRESLTKLNRLVDPNQRFNKRQARRAAQPDYEVPSIETVPSSWYDNFATRLKSAKEAALGKRRKSKVRTELDGTLTYSVNR